MEGVADDHPDVPEAAAEDPVEGVADPEPVGNGQIIQHGEAPPLNPFPAEMRPEQGETPQSHLQRQMFAVSTVNLELERERGRLLAVQGNAPVAPNAAQGGEVPNVVARCVNCSDIIVMDLDRALERLPPPKPQKAGLAMRRVQLEALQFDLPCLLMRNPFPCPTNPTKRFHKDETHKHDGDERNWKMVIKPDRGEFKFPTVGRCKLWTDDDENELKRKADDKRAIDDAVKEARKKARADRSAARDNAGVA